DIGKAHRNDLTLRHLHLGPGKSPRPAADRVLAWLQRSEAPALVNVGHWFLGLEVENLPLVWPAIFWRPSHQLNAGVDLHIGRLARDHGDLTPGKLQRMITHREQADPVLARRQRREAPALVNVSHRLLGLEVESLPLGKWGI